MALMLLSVAPLIFLVNGVDDPAAMIPLVGAVTGMCAIVVLIVWVNNANWGTSISLDGQTLTLRDYTGRISSCALREARFDNTSIATRDAVVILGRPQAQVYDRESVQAHLIPRLGDAQRVGPIAMLKIQIELRHPQGIVAILAVIGALIAVVATI